MGLIFSAFVVNNQSLSQKSELIAFVSYKHLGRTLGRTIPVTLLPVAEMIGTNTILQHHDFYNNIKTIEDVLLEEEENQYKREQGGLTQQNLKKVLNST